MRELEAPWVLVLAGGDGTRLSTVTRDAHGRLVPKQYCRFGGERSLLGSTLRRTRQLVPPERTLVVVSERHRAWWSRELAGLPRCNVIVQPANRGTAAGLLLPLRHLESRAPAAPVLILPSDHHLEDEATFVAAAARACRSAQLRRRVTLLGLAPDAPETDYGWIVPGASGDDGTAEVARFVEKPDARTASELLLEGGLWSSFVIAADVRDLLALFQRALPDLVRQFRADGLFGEHEVGVPMRLRRLYEKLQDVDFSSEVLQPCRERLRTALVPECGWTDLGTPERLRDWLARPSVLASTASGHAMPGA